MNDEHLIKEEKVQTEEDTQAGRVLRTKDPEDGDLLGGFMEVGNALHGIIQ